MPKVLLATEVGGLLGAAPRVLGTTISEAFGLRVVAGGLALAIASYIALRTILWIPVVVDQGESVVGALKLSWSMTRKRTRLIFPIFAFVGIPVAIIGAALQQQLVVLVGFRCLVFAVAIGACCRLYCHVLVLDQSQI
jgi:hypothetical protein